MLQKNSSRRNGWVLQGPRQKSGKGWKGLAKTCRELTSRRFAKEGVGDEMQETVGLEKGGGIEFPKML